MSYIVYLESADGNTVIPTFPDQGVFEAFYALPGMKKKYTVIEEGISEQRKSEILNDYTLSHCDVVHTNVETILSNMAKDK